MGNTVYAVIKRYGGDPTRLMDILIDVQSELGYLSDWTVEQVSKSLDLPRVEVEQTLSFYHFFAREPRGKYTVYLNTSVVAGFYGRTEVAAAFERAAGCRFGELSPDGLIGLFDTSCIGMSDQEPAALINETVFPSLTAPLARTLVEGMRAELTIPELLGRAYGEGDGQNGNPLIHAAVKNNIRRRGEVVLSPYPSGAAIHHILSKRLSSSNVIDLVKRSSLRGRGGAGFPTAMKWEVARKAPGDPKYIFCNADEGEPGTFKDRVILTELPKLVFDGMVVAAYAVGARWGILYLRNEYRYLRDYLENALEEMRADGLLGMAIGGARGFNFDIRIQFGAGAYVCGEESALIESAEGKRGEPRDRPPYPVENGYLGKPTVVNNVETLCSVARIVINGPEWYNAIGTAQSHGTKVLSVSGDCDLPGIYEIPWGFTVNDVLAMAGARDTQAVQVGGPSGSCIGPDEFGRTLAYEDLATGGSLIIIGRARDLLSEVVLNFTEFFREESCGSCVPCRALTGMSKLVLEKILAGKGTAAEVDAFLGWASIMKRNRCGLGQTALNPIITTIKNFRRLYDERLRERDPSLNPAFDLSAATGAYRSAVSRA